MRVEDPSVLLTALMTRYGLFEFPLLPFYLTNTPTFFLDLINKLFQPSIDRFVIIFINDILVCPHNEIEHEHLLKHVLELL